MALLENDKKTLLIIARKTLESRLNKKQVPEFEILSDILKEKRAVFVTLKKDGSLRGCIGRIVADTPLYKTVSNVVVDSAFNDPRFNEVNLSELDQIDIEISVMTPFEKIGSFDEIEVGVHGLMLKLGFNSGLFLPQVATEQGWDKKTYLEQLSLKAGIDADAYLNKEAVIYKFSAQVFGEKDFLSNQ